MQSRPFRAPVPETPPPPFDALLEHLSEAEAICRALVVELSTADARHQAKRILFDTVGAWNQAARLACWALSDYDPACMIDALTDHRPAPTAE